MTQKLAVDSNNFIAVLFRHLFRESTLHVSWVVPVAQDSMYIRKPKAGKNDAITS